MAVFEGGCRKAGVNQGKARASQVCFDPGRCIQKNKGETQGESRVPLLRQAGCVNLLSVTSTASLDILEVSTLSRSLFHFVIIMT